MADNKNKGIPGFSPQEFAENITSQASEVIPPEFQPADKQFIAEVIKKFCFMAGDAIVQDPNAGLNADQASLICQFIGEWTFHKSIDLTRGGVDINLREQVLQKVAFTIFEIAKQAIKKGMSQEDLIPLVETHVNKSFKNALEDLKKRNIIDEKTLKQAESQSNVDAMAQASIEQETSVIKEMSDTKILKLASLALLIKGLPEAKREAILRKFNSPEETVLRDYLKMENLEAKVDPRITQRCLGEVKSILPEPKHSSSERCMFKLRKIIYKNGKSAINNLLKNERPLIKNIAECAHNDEKPEISPKITITLYNYITEKVS